jgi:hypothetical protein
MTWNDLITILILGGATWRVSHMLVNEDGPGDIFVRFRVFAGVRYDEFSRPYGNGFLPSLFTCVYCMSVWVALVLGLLYVLLPIPYGYWLVGGLAVSTVAILISGIEGE